MLQKTLLITFAYACLGLLRGQEIKSANTTGITESNMPLLATIVNVYNSIVGLSKDFSRFPLNDSYAFNNKTYWNLTSNETLTFHQRLDSFLGGLGIGLECQRDLTLLNSGLEQQQDWALRMIDAFGKPGSDLMDLRFTWIGSYDECVELSSKDIINDNSVVGGNANDIENDNDALKIDGSNNKNYINGQYCWIHFPFNQEMTPASAKYILMRENFIGPLGFRLGSCFPDSCSENDIESVVKAISEQIGTSKTSFDLNTRCKISKPLSAAAICCITLLIILGMLLAAGTAYDIIVLRLQLLSFGKLTNAETDTHKKETIRLYDGENQASGLNGVNSGNIIDNTNTDKVAIERNGRYGDAQSILNLKYGNFHRFCMAFSILQNGEAILNVNESKTRVNAVEGIRVLTLAWIVLIHVGFFGNNLSANSDLYSMGKLTTPILAVMSPFPVDTFFTLGGFVLSYVMLRKLKQCGGYRRVNWGLFYLFRFWRLSPTFYIVFLVYWKLIFGGYFSGPLWFNSDEAESWAASCDKDWWKLLLYFHNFADKKQCFPSTWYLAADMQMYFLTPLVLIPLYCFSKAGFLIGGVCIVGSIVYTMAVSLVNGFLPKYSGIGAKGLSHGDLYIYLTLHTPFTHISPYVIGMMAGYILYKRRETVVLSKTKNLIGWIVAISTCLIVSCVPFMSLDNHDLASPENLATKFEYHGYFAVYEGLARSLWSTSICWMIFACAVGKGGFINTLLGWKPFVVLGRLSYSTYLIHEIVLLVYYQSRRTLKFDSDISMGFDTVGVTIMSFGAGFLLSVCLELPSFALRKLLFKEKE